MLMAIILFVIGFVLGSLMYLYYSLNKRVEELVSDRNHIFARIRALEELFRQNGFKVPFVK